MQAVQSAFCRSDSIGFRDMPRCGFASLRRQAEQSFFSFFICLDKERRKRYCVFLCFLFSLIQFIPQHPSKAVRKLESEIDAHPSFPKTFFGAVDCKRCTVAVKSRSGEIIGLAYFVDFERRSSKLETAFLVFRFFGDFDCIVHAFKKNICEHLCINAASAFANFGNAEISDGSFAGYAVSRVLVSLSR